MAIAAHQGIGAIAANQRVIAGGTIQHIGQAVTQNGVIAGTTQDILDATKAVIAIRAERAPRAKVNRDLSGSLAVDDPVTAIAADKAVTPTPPHQRIGITIANQCVITKAPIDTLNAAQRVIAGSARGLPTANIHEIDGNRATKE